MTLTENSFKQPTMISLILAVFVSFGLGATPGGLDSTGRKGGPSGKAGLTQVAKDFQNPGRPAVSDDEFTLISGGIPVPPSPCGCYACNSARQGPLLARPVNGAVRGRAPPAVPRF